MTHLYTAGLQLPGSWIILRSIALSLENDRYHYRAEDVWALASICHGAVELECQLGMARCYYEGRKMRKGDAAIEAILEKHPNHPQALDLVNSYRRDVA